MELDAAPAVWVEAEPDCPWARAWLTAALALPDRRQPVVVVSRSESAWSDLRADWADLRVVGDPDGAVRAARFPRDPLSMGVAGWDGDQRVFVGVPAAFSGGAYASEAIADRIPDGGWVAFSNPPWRNTAAPPYGGRLDVLVDHDVCSSGETFLFLASQVPGARLVGENSAGCLGNGNVRSWPRLPATRLRVHFGVTAFFGAPRDAAEGAGAFPDVWLDVPDPVAYLQALP